MDAQDPLDVVLKGKSAQKGRYPILILFRFVFIFDVLHHQHTKTQSGQHLLPSTLNVFFSCVSCANLLIQENKRNLYISFFDISCFNFPLECCHERNLGIARQAKNDEKKSVLLNMAHFSPQTALHIISQF